MIVLDASVLIAYLDAEDAQHEAAEVLLAREIDDEFVVNPLTLAEVLVGPVRTGLLDAALTALRDLEVEERSFPTDTDVQLARLGLDTRLRMPDCGVMLIAQDGAARVASFDGRLVSAAEELGLVALTS